MSIRKAIGKIYLIVGILALLFAVQIIIFFISIEMLPARFSYMVKMILSGKITPEYVDIIGGAIMGLFINLNFGILLILIGAGIIWPKYTTPRLHTLCSIVLILLICVQLWRFFVFGMLNAIEYVFCLFFILGFTLFQAKFQGVPLPQDLPSNAIFRRRLFYGLLVFVSVALLANFIFSIYKVTKFPGVLSQ